jgi:hypothetical protein
MNKTRAGSLGVDLNFPDFDPNALDMSTFGDHRAEVLNQAKIELRMNHSLLEMLKGNTPLADLANLREQWVEPLEKLIKELKPADGSRQDQ